MPINSFENYHLSWQPRREQLTSPYYRSLADLLEADIRSGVLAGGAKLPPQRELADFLDIHFTTVTRAYEECKKRNLIYGITGSGTYVNPQAVKPIVNSKDTIQQRKAEFGYESVIELGFTSSFDETNRIIAEHLPAITARMDPMELLDLRNPTGAERHRQIGLDWMARFGIHAPVAQAAIVSGSMNGLTVCLLSLFKSGDRIAVDQYINTNVIELAKLLRIQLVPVAMDTEGMIPEALEQVCEQSSVRGVYLMPSCNNPTTVRMPIERKIALSRVIQKHDLIVLEDDQYAFISAGYLPDYVVPMRELLPEQTIYICSAATAICSGLRIAYLVFPYRYLDAIYNAICNINVKTSGAEAEIICRLIESGVADQVVQAKAELARQANAIFDELFPGCWTGHPYSFFRWLEIPDSWQSDTVGWQLLAQGVHVYHSRRFACGKEDGTAHLRIALSSADSLEQLRQGLLKVKQSMGL